MIFGDVRTLVCLGQVRALYEGEFPRPPVVVQFAACGNESAEDIVGLFAGHFYFGGEGNEPTGPDTSAVLAQGWEPAQKGFDTPGVFTNPVRLHAGMSPGFSPAPVWDPR